MSPVTHDLALASRLRALTATMVRSARQSTPRDLTLSQLSMLATVERSGPMRLGALASAERIDPAVATRLVAWLDDSGHLRRTTDPLDRRASLVAITAKGRRALTATRDGRVGALQRRLDDLSAAELRQVDAALQVLEKLFHSS
jgi:DNA-binding MarR family transcriptional regulator